MHDAARPDCPSEMLSHAPGASTHVYSTLSSLSTPKHGSVDPANAVVTEQLLRDSHACWTGPITSAAVHVPLPAGPGQLLLALRPNAADWMRMTLPVGQDIGTAGALSHTEAPCNAGGGGGGNGVRKQLRWAIAPFSCAAQAHATARESRYPRPCRSLMHPCLAAPPRVSIPPHAPTAQRVAAPRTWCVGARVRDKELLAHANARVGGP